ncbi:MAG: transaldolase [Candidatus Latescibacterota bacterium]
MALLEHLRVRIFADGADRDGMLGLYANPLIAGFTTNPTLMRRAGVRDYRAFALDILQAIPDRPISFEVFSDDFAEMECQARQMASWASNVFVKIPVTNTRGQPSGDLVRRLCADGIQLNVTALLSLAQVRQVAGWIQGGSDCFVSVFAGRVADTGRDPVPLMAAAAELLRPLPNARLLWASPRELLNIFQADAVGCDCITVTHDLLAKLPLVGQDLEALSLDTVRMFRRDAEAAGYRL